MAEIIISVATKVVERLVDPVVHQGQYLLCVGKFIKSLENRKKELASTRDGVLKRVEEANKKAEKIENAVEKWLSEVNNLLEEVERLEQEVKTNNSCLRGWCPSWRRYQLCKQMSKKTNIMTELNINSKFEPFSRLASLPSIDYFSSGNFTFFESTMFAYHQLLEAIQDDNTYMIGMYGMGGSGKTTLAIEVGKKAKELKYFDQVVFTTVSQTPNVTRIQDDIADLLGLKLDEKTETARAQRISLRLRSGERILIILDDVWTKLNLEDIGIIFDGHLKSCKVLLTTRRREVCVLMRCERKIPLDLLSEEETWNLFQKLAGIGDEHFPSLGGVARKLAAECKGLPIAIKAVATSLRGKSIDEWKVALRRLRDSKPIDVEEEVGDVFTCLKLSYDYLKSREAQSLLLMCSMFPEDHEIFIEDLFRYGIGLGLCGKVSSFEVARSQVNAAINNLIESCLLMRSENRNNHLKMHVIIRDVALWIAFKEDCVIAVNPAINQNESAEDEYMIECHALSSWYKNTDQFPNQLNAPKLEILLLNSSSILDLSHASFAGMKGLKVMAIINSEDHIISTIQLSVPQSIQLLTNLRTLRLVGCKLGDISFVVSLRSLEILDLQKSKFKALPNGIEKLNKLKLLDLSRCRIDESCDEVIGKCSQLEELFVYSKEEHFGATIIGSYDCFLENLTFPKLQRFILQIGQFKGDLELWHSSRRVLLLGEFNISTSSAIIKDLLQRAEDVGLDSLHGGCKGIIPEFVEAVGSMDQLTKLWLHSCSEIEFLIHSTSHHDHDFPMLFELRLQNMDHLRQVFHGPPPPRIFQNLEQFRIDNCCQLRSIFPGECELWNLKYFSISNCPKLTSLFPMSVARTLLQLEKLVVRNCCEVRHILMNEGQIGTDTGDEIVSVSESSGFMFPKLMCLSVSNCDELEYLLPISFAQRPEQLQELWFQNASELKNVFGKHEEIGIPNFPQMKGIFPREWNLINLKILSVGGFPECTSLFSISVAQSLLVLEELHVKRCRELKYILFNEEDDTATREQKVPVPDNSPSIFSNLKILTVSDCDKLEYIFPDYCARGLVRLQELKVKNAPQMKYVISKHDQKRTPALEPSKTRRNLLRKQSSKMATPEETGHD